MLVCNSKILGAPYPYVTLGGITTASVPRVPSQQHPQVNAVLKSRPSYMTDDWISSSSRRLPPGYHDINALALKDSALRTSYQPLVQAELGSRPAKRYKLDQKKWRNRFLAATTGAHVHPVPSRSVQDNSALMRAVMHHDELIDAAYGLMPPTVPGTAHIPESNKSKNYDSSGYLFLAIMFYNFVVSQSVG